MKTTLVYQRWVECELPVGAAMWSWPVVLSDGRVILTLLYRPLPTPGTAGGAAGGMSGVKLLRLQTVILELSAKGEAKLWQPGAGYPAPVIFYANERDELFGIDLVKRGKVYVCRVDGTHCYSLETTVRMETMIAPTSFHQVGGVLHWVTAAGKGMRADVSSGEPRDVREGAVVLPAEEEIRFPHTHVTRDGSLFILDFDPMARVTRYRL